MNNKERPYKEIGERINTLIAENNSTQKELAERLNILPNIVSYYCGGSRIPPVDQLVKIADHYNTTVDYLLGRTDVKSPDTELQGVCAYLGLPEETLNALKDTSCKDVLNTLVQSEYFEELLFCFETLFSQFRSILIQIEKDPQCLEEIAELRRIKVWTREYENASKVQRFNASETLTRILDLFDFRTRNSEKYAMIKEKVEAYNKKYVYLSEHSDENKASE